MIFSPQMSCYHWLNQILSLGGSGLNQPRQRREERDLQVENHGATRVETRLSMNKSQTYALLSKFMKLEVGLPTLIAVRAVKTKYFNNTVKASRAPTLHHARVEGQAKLV